MKFNLINDENIYLIACFKEELNSSSFRYFESRTIECIKNHITTLIITDDDESIIGYGHLDYDSYVWLGICVLDHYKGKGYGKKIMDFLIDQAEIKKINDIYLTVDNNNYIAKKLYMKYGFIVVQEYDTYCKMKKNINSR